MSCSLTTAVPFSASRTAGWWPRTPLAVPGCRGPDNAGLKGQRRAAASTRCPSERPGRPGRPEARLPQPAAACDWRRRGECWTPLVPPRSGQNGAGEALLRTAPAFRSGGPRKRPLTCLRSRIWAMASRCDFKRHSRLQQGNKIIVFNIKVSF